MSKSRSRAPWLRLLVATAITATFGVVVGVGAPSQAALEFDTDGNAATLEQLTRFQIDGDGVETPAAQRCAISGLSSSSPPPGMRNCEAPAVASCASA